MASSNNIFPAATVEADRRSTKRFPAVRLPTEPSATEIAGYVARLGAQIAERSAGRARAAADTVRPPKRAK